MATRSNRGNTGSSRDAGQARRRDGATRADAPRQSAGTSRPVGASRSTRGARDARATETARTQRRSRLADLPRIEDEPRAVQEPRESRNASHRANVNRAARSGQGRANQPASARGQQTRARTAAAVRAEKEAPAPKKGKRQAPTQAQSKAPAQAKAPSRRSGRRTAASARLERGQAPGSTRVPTRRNTSRETGSDEAELVSTSIGELRRSERRKRAQRSSRRFFLRIIIAVVVVAVFAVGGVVLYHSPAFTIQNVQVNGVEHLTGEEMAAMANVPHDSTLLRVDTGTIEKRVEQNAWVADAQISLLFPDTLQINVTERAVSAVIEIPTSNGTSVKKWLISDDRIWLMPVPDAGSDAAKTTSSKVFDDAASVIHIVDVPIGTKAEIGSACTDVNVNNALDILSGLTTDLSGQVAEVSAAGTAETTLLLNSGVEVAFGKAEDIRDKERVVLQILQENPDNVTYINVRIPTTPTWRAV